MAMPSMSTTAEQQPGSELIFQPNILPCGRKIQNKLVKVAMYEHLSTFPGGQPNELHFRLYSEWARHRWGMVITGNVQVAADHLSLGRDIVLPEDLKKPRVGEVESFERLAKTIHGGWEINKVTGAGNDNSQIEKKTNRTLAILQLNHTGRQSSNFIGGRWPFRAPVAPSPIRVGSTPGRNPGHLERLVNTLLFQTPRAMNSDDIQSIVDRFVEGSVFAQKTGFDGVQLHVAHGYLLAQFLSPQVNQRTDEYSYEKALDLLRTIVGLIRSSTSKDFVIGIKLNAADYTSSIEPDSSSSLTSHEQRAMQHLSRVASWGLVDFVEISGGDYETPEFMANGSISNPPSSSKEQKYESGPNSRSRRQAFFARFSQQAVKQLSACNPTNRPLILLTGGLNSPKLLATALASKHADLLGIGRASVLSPGIPSILKSLAAGSSSDPIDPDQPFSPAPTLSNPSILSQPPISWVWSLLSSVKLVGAGTTMAWYTLHMRTIAMMSPRGSDGRRLKPPKPDYGVGGIESVLRTFFWVLPSETVGSGSRRLPGMSFVVACVVVGLVSYWLAITAGDVWTLSVST